MTTLLWNVRFSICTTAVYRSRMTKNCSSVRICAHRCIQNGQKVLCKQDRWKTMCLCTMGAQNFAISVEFQKGFYGRRYCCYLFAVTTSSAAFHVQLSVLSVGECHVWADPAKYRKVDRVASTKCDMEPKKINIYSSLTPTGAIAIVFVWWRFFCILVK